MEFEGAGLDQRVVKGLVRSVSGSFDTLIGAEHREDRVESEDDGLECRVCSGSIMYTHEDCLMSWLRHSNKDSCELCGQKFKFVPVYAANTPGTVPLWEVAFSCSRMAVLEWLPFGLRMITAGFLWLVVVPLATSWLYRIWIHRTRIPLVQLFVGRMSCGLECAWSDLVSGLIIAAAIILSFLSLMTFADFLADQIMRNDWDRPRQDEWELRQDQQRQQQQPVQQQAVVPERDVLGGAWEVAGEDVQEHPNAQGTGLLRPGEEEDESENENEEVDPVWYIEDPQAEQDLLSGDGTKTGEQKIAEGGGEEKENISLGVVINVNEGQGHGTGEGEEHPVEVVLKLKDHYQLPFEATDTVATGNRQEHEHDMRNTRLGARAQLHNSQARNLNEMGLGAGATDGQDQGQRVEDERELHPEGRPLGARDHHRVLQQIGGGDIGGPGAAQLPAAAAAAAAAAAEGRGGGFGGDAPAPLDNAGDNLDPLDGDVHLALDELLGVRGHPSLLIRNVLWLLLFNAAYVGLFAFIPYCIGSSMISAYTYTPDLRPVLKGFSLVWTREDSVSEGQSYIDLLIGLMAQTSEPGVTDHTLQLHDLSIICLGYGVMAAMVLTWRSIIRALPMMRRAKTIMKISGAVVKVGILLSMKMLLLPLGLGACLDIITLVVFGSQPADRIAFMSHNLIGCMLFHWVMGITYMLFVTVSVLQLREVMHPAILSAIIRPQEPHPDLLGSLLQESGRTHAWRTAMSLSIYVGLLFLFVWVPRYLLQVSAPWVLPFSIHLAHVVPRLQIPIELAVFHLAILSFLERFKNCIGDIQHVWLVWVCRQLGLQRYLLPMAIEDNGGNPRVVPVARPPVGWDDGVGDSKGRWAWGNEEVGSIEASLVPREKPRFLVPALLALVAAGWVHILCICVASVALPVATGRCAFKLLHVPDAWIHDPAAMAIGAVVCRASYQIVSGVVAAVRRSRRAARSWKPPTAGQAGALLVFSLLWFVVSPLLVGLLFDIVFGVTAHSWEQHGWAAFSPIGELSLGLALLHVWAYLCYLGLMDGLRVCYAEVLLCLERAVIRGEWEQLRLQLLVLEYAGPIAVNLARCCFLPALVSFSLCLLRLQERFGSIGATSPTSTLGAFAELLVQDFQLLVFRSALLAYALIVAGQYLLEPCSRWLKMLHDSVRDDRYLLGLQLLNHPATATKMHAKTKVH